MSSTYETTPRNLRDGSIVLKDGTAVTPIVMDILVDEGDLSWTEHRNVIETLNRGALLVPRLGDQAACDVSFTFRWTVMLGSTGVTSPDTGLTPWDIFTKYKVASESLKADTDSWTTTWDNSSDPYSDVFMIKIVFTCAPVNPSGTAETVTFNYFFVLDVTPAEGDDNNTISVTGKSWETRPTIAAAA